MGRLRTLIDTLRDLFTQILSKLLHGRLQRQQAPEKGRGGIPISELMADHITEADEDLGRGKDGADDESRVAPAPMAGGFANTRPLKNDSEPPLPGFFSALSQRFSWRRSKTRLEPFMAEKMRATTLDHVNKALGFARQGNAEGARIHAQLAETAMETAGEYMSDEEYSQLKERVEARLRPSSSRSGRS